MVFGGLQQLGAVLREELLVGGHHRLAGGEGGELDGARRLDAADQLDDDVDGGVGDELGEVGRDVHARRHLGAALGRQLADRAQAHVLAGRQADLVGAFVQQPPDAGAYRAVPHKSDADLVHRCPFVSAVTWLSALSPCAAGRRSAASFARRAQARAAGAPARGCCSRSTSSHVSRAMITRASPPATMTTAGRGWPL